MALRVSHIFSSLGLWPRTRSARRVVFDLLVIAGSALLFRLATLRMNLFERFYEFSRAHESWQLDEWTVTIAIGGMAFIGFGVRRMQDQRRELSLRLAAEQHAIILALQDPLTGLPNRRRFQDVLAATAAEPGHHALFVLDLDGFKQVNDVFGHSAGDETLRTTAQRLRAFGAEHCFCARLGGDEFALILRNIADRQQAETVASRVIGAIEVPIAAAGVEHRVEVSVGIALFDGGSERGEEHLRRADVALYRAKTNRGSAFTVYDKEMDADIGERVRLEQDFREALAENQIVPFYQPIVDLKTGAIVKFEALARWRHPVRGDVAPAIFIPLAENRGLIAELTEFMLRQACRDAMAWPPNVMLSVNLSPLLLAARSFNLRIVQILAETGLPPTRLELEITERALESDFEDVRPFLEDLKALGIRIALDDFGTGYSSLSRLRRLPFDDLKIDRSFVQSMADSADRMLFIRTILELGRGLGLTVTAEGVEEPGQRDSLIAEGCTHGQGFLYSEAVSAERTQLLLVGEKKAAAETRTAR